MSPSSETSTRLPDPVRISEDGRTVLLLDQTLLPSREAVLRLLNPEEVVEAIGALRVRGAPAIGIAAAYGIALGFAPPPRDSAGGPSASAVSGGGPIDPARVGARFEELSSKLRATRPTAVNLGWALDRMRGILDSALGEGPISASALHMALVSAACAIHAEDARACRAIGLAGRAVFPERKGRRVRVLTHCNAGALATGGIGTALAPIYLFHEEGGNVEVLSTETRPLLQGSRLTAWELSKAGIPVTVITDSMAGAAMASGRVDLVLVGADRIASNGDVANKIGTYGLAILARSHGIPFYVAAPDSTFDRRCPTGAEIPIEERGAVEVRADGAGPEDPTAVAVWNPAFDITPGHLVTAYITEAGIAAPLMESGGEQ